MLSIVVVNITTADLSITTAVDGPTGVFGEIRVSYSSCTCTVNTSVTVIGSSIIFENRVFDSSCASAVYGTDIYIVVLGSTIINEIGIVDFSVASTVNGSSAIVCKISVSYSCRTAANYSNSSSSCPYKITIGNFCIGTAVNSTRTVISEIRVGYIYCTCTIDTSIILSCIAIKVRVCYCQA